MEYTADLLLAVETLSSFKLTINFKFNLLQSKQKLVKRKRNVLNNKLGQKNKSSVSIFSVKNTSVMCQLTTRGQSRPSIKIV